MFARIISWALLLGMHLIGVHLMGVVCLEAFRFFDWGFLGKSRHTPLRRMYRLVLHLGAVHILLSFKS